MLPFLLEPGLYLGEHVLIESHLIHASFSFCGIILKGRGLRFSDCLNFFLSENIEAAASISLGDFL